MIRVLTIGQIAYIDSQIYFVSKLGNCDGIAVQFSGAGPAVPSLEAYVSESHFENIFFTGRYEKINEPEIVKSADMINIWLKSDVNADSCMANRFYLSALFHKPMIVHKGSYMAELCNQFGLGVVLKEGDDFAKCIKDWFEDYDYETFSNGCRLFLESVKQDIYIFENRLISLFAETECCEINKF